jgi:hypothetical protein
LYRLIDIFLFLNLSNIQMQKLSILFTFFFVFLSTSYYSQQPNTLSTGKEIIKTHYYTFEGYATQEKLDELQQALVHLEFATEAKVKYKSEKSAGQIIMITKEPQSMSENHKGFSAPMIKRTIINFGLAPLEYIKGETSTK